MSIVIININTHRVAEQAGFIPDYSKQLRHLPTAP